MQRDTGRLDWTPSRADFSQAGAESLKGSGRLTTECVVDGIGTV